jgi:hypothetical protein
MQNRINIKLAAVGAAVALALGGGAVAQASHGADDPAGHHHGHHGNHSEPGDDHGHHGPNHTYSSAAVRSGRP